MKRWYEGGQKKANRTSGHRCESCGSLVSYLLLEPVGLLLHKRLVGVTRMLLYVAVEIVGDARVGHVEHHHDPVVGKRDVLGEEAIAEQFVAAESLHHTQVLQLVPRL